jgi:hypothetical protein
VNNSKENKTMFGINRVAIGDGERGLLYKNRRFVRVLAPGVCRLWDVFGALEVRSFDITRPDFIGKDVDALIERLGAELELSFALADIGVEEVGLVSKSGKLEDVLAPGMRKMYWKGPVSVTLPIPGLWKAAQLRSGCHRVGTRSTPKSRRACHVTEAGLLPWDRSPLKRRPCRAVRELPSSRDYARSARARHELHRESFSHLRAA